MLALVLLLVAAQGASGPVVDGRLGAGEWAGAARHALTGGGELYLLAQGDLLYVGIRGSKPGLASLCVASGDRVRILHASAAVGEGGYVKDGASWAKRTDFEFALRDSPRGGGPTAADRAAYFQKTGWVANASATGSPEREFQIRLADVEAIGVTYLAIDEPMAMAYWPASLDDDCRALKMAQGYLPAAARFSTASWHRVEPRR